jgi:hypothetical protein
VASAGWQELPEKFEVSSAAETARLQRRLEYVLRQLEWRIMEADRLRVQAAEEHAQLEVLHDELEAQNREAVAWRNAYESLMATKTVRAARLPRALYARIRGRSQPKG